MNLTPLISYLDKNTDDWEIYVEKSSLKYGEIDKGKLKIILTSNEFGYGIRVINNGKVGFSSSNNPDLAIEVANKAIKLAKFSNKRLKSFSVGKMSDIKGLYDKRFDEISSEFIKDCIDRLTNSALELNKNINPAKGKIEFSKTKVNIINSCGCQMEYTSTFCESSLEVVFKNYYGFEIAQSRLIDINLEEVGKKAAKLALMSEKPTKIEKGKYDVVLSPIAVNQLFYFTFYPAVLSNNILKGRSPLCNKIGEKLGELTIIDDGTLDYGLASVPFDDEGVKSKKTIVLEDGVLKSYLFDLEHAEIMNAESTGNGFREDYTTYPSPHPSNVILKFKEKENNIEDDAILIHSFIGSHTSNPVSGDFSLESMNAFLVKKGKKFPLKQFMIYENIYNLIKKIECFGKDVRQIDCTVSSSIRFNDVNIIL